MFASLAGGGASASTIVKQVALAFGLIPGKTLEEMAAAIANSITPTCADGCTVTPLGRRQLSNARRLQTATFTMSRQIDNSSDPALLSAPLSDPPSISTAAMASTLSLPPNSISAPVVSVTGIVAEVTTVVISEVGSPEAAATLASMSAGLSPASLASRLGLPTSAFRTVTSVVGPPMPPPAVPSPLISSQPTYPPFSPLSYQGALTSMAPANVPPLDIGSGSAETPVAPETIAGVSTAVTAVLTTSIAASIGASIHAAAAAAAGGDGGGGGAVTPLIFGAQRFVANANIGGELHQGVASSLSWACGEFSFLSSDDDLTLRRMQSTDTTSSSGRGTPLPPELAALVNLLITFSIGIIMTFAIQLTLVLVWEKLINRRYYLQQAALKEAREAIAPDAAELRRLEAWDVGPERLFFGVFGPRRKLQPPRFFAWPKSLVWPSPLFFTTCMFGSGITRASVRLLAASPPDCGHGCNVLPVALLVCLVVLILIVVGDLLTFRAKHGKEIKWTPAARCDDPNKVDDPWMRLSAQVRVRALNRGAAVSNRTVSVKHTTRVHPHTSLPRFTMNVASGAPAADGIVDDQMLTPTRTRMRPVSLPASPPASPPLSPPASPPANPPVHAAPASYPLATGGRGFRDRKSGAWSINVADVEEPERTERLLAAPFALRRSRTGDTWQTFEGFLMFRVNGDNQLSSYYRLLVIGVNITFGVLSGLQSLLPASSVAALVQTALILVLQLGMSIVCFVCLPDADRVISRFAGSQFCVEGLSTGALLFAEVRTWYDSNFVADATMQNTGFILSLIAMGVPILQLLEQRLLMSSGKTGGAFESAEEEAQSASADAEDQAVKEGADSG